MNGYWPYLEHGVGTESDRHVRLKNCAIEWLLSEGYELEDIENERVYGTDERPQGKGRTDLYASRGGHGAVFVECERNFTPTRAGLSRGGQVPFEDGERVVVVTDDGVFEVGRKQVEMSTNDPFGPQGTQTVERYSFEKIDELPRSGFLE